MWNQNNALRFEQHVLMEGLSATNTHPNIVRSCMQHHPDECHSNEKCVVDMWKLLISRGIIQDAVWRHSLHITELARSDEDQGENQLMFVIDSLVIKCVGKDHDYEFNARTKINVYKKEQEWGMLSTLGVVPMKYLRSSLPRLVEIQLRNAVLLHLGNEIKEDGDPKEVLQLVADEKIEYKSTPTDNPGSDVPR